MKGILIILLIFGLVLLAAVAFALVPNLMTPAAPTLPAPNAGGAAGHQHDQKQGEAAEKVSVPVAPGANGRSWCRGGSQTRPYQNTYDVPILNRLN